MICNTCNTLPVGSHKTVTNTWSWFMLYKKISYFMELPDAYHVHISSSLSYHLCLNFPLKYSSAIKKHHDPLHANLLFFFFHLFCLFTMWFGPVHLNIQTLFQLTQPHTCHCIQKPDKTKPAWRLFWILRYEADLKFQVKCKHWLFGNISIILEIRKNLVSLTRCSLWHCVTDQM